MAGAKSWRERALTELSLCVGAKILDPVRPSRSCACSLASDWVALGCLGGTVLGVRAQTNYHQKLSAFYPYQE